MPDISLKGKILISGAIEAVTGLHIGGATGGLDIGGVDLPILRHPRTQDTPRHNSRYISSELSRLTVKCLS